MNITGASAVNKTVKVVVIAHRLVKKGEDKSIKVISEFVELPTAGDEKIGI